MKKHLKLIDGTSDKFWQIEAVNNSFTVTYGKNGTSGVSQTKTFDSEAQCLKEAEKILAEKIKKGYSEDGESGVVSISTKPKTEKQSDLQAILDEYDTLIKTSNLDGLLPFLKNHANGNREALKKHIKGARKYWIEHTEVAKDSMFNWLRPSSKYGWQQRGTEKQQRMVTLSALALVNRSETNVWTGDFLRFFYAMQGKESTLFEILEWGKVDWLDTFLLAEYKKNMWLSVNFERLRALENRNLIAYNPELFVLSLARFTLQRIQNDTQYDYDKHYEIVEKNLRDVKELFNYDANLQRYSFSEISKGEKREWIYVYFWNVFFKRLINEGKLERDFFIENALLIQTKDWFNDSKTFFRTILNEIDIKSSELLAFQHIIFTFFHVPLNSIINYGIDLTKKIIEEKDFDTDAFLEWIEPVMLRADCKTGVKTLITMLDKLAKREPTYKAKIANLMADVIMIPDLILQERVSKSILKIGDVNDADLKEKLTMYASEMLGQVSSILADFLEKETISELFEVNTSENYVFLPKKENVLREENRVVLPKDWNEILFQFGKFSSSEEVLDAEILLNAFVTQRHLFPKDYEKQLQPYIKKLQKTGFNDSYKSVLSGFLIQKTERPDADFRITDVYFQRSNVTILFTKLLYQSDKMLRKNGTLPLLCLPTHAPYWIEPKILVERILACQKLDEAIDARDLTFALSRMCRENVEDVLDLCEQLPSEIGEIVTFCLGKHKNISLKEEDFSLHLLRDNKGKNTYNALWASVARIHYPNEIFNVFEKTTLNSIPNVIEPIKIEPFFKECWHEWKDYYTNELTRGESWYELRQDLPRVQEMPSALLYSMHVLGLQDGSNWWFYIGSGDVQYWQSVMPQNYEPLVMSILENTCKRVNQGSKMLFGFVKIAQSQSFQFSEVSTLILACCLFNDKKELRAIATEVLIQHIENQTIGVSLLAEKIAFLINNDYGPVSRVIESFTTIKDVSPLHNSALIILLESTIGNLELKEKLPTNFKKILEIFYDLKAKMKQKVSEKVILVLKPLEENGTLKSIVKQILALK